MTKPGVLIVPTFRYVVFALLASILAFAGCFGDETSSRSDTIQSCYDTGHGIKCVSTPGAVSIESDDVDGDGNPDTFVCGDGASESDSDGDSSLDSDSTSDSDGDTAGQVSASQGSDLDADSESGSDSNSDSDEDCANSEADGPSDSDSESDAEGDGDADGVLDEYDCDCQTP